MPSPEFIRFKKVLKSNGHFVTKPRMRLFGLLQNNPALTIVQLVDKTPAHDRSTIYRNIGLFEALGIITTLRMGSSTKLELSDKFQHHHHHITCTRCGRVAVLRENKSIEDAIAHIGRGSGYKITDHQLEIRGLCLDCQKTLDLMTQ